MRALGIAVSLPSRGRPVASCAIVDRTVAGHDVLQNTFQITTTQEDLASQLADLATAARSRARSLGVDTAWVRRADKPPRASNTEGPRARLLAEGAITAAVGEVVEIARIGDGKTIGQTLGVNKTQADALGAGLAGPDFEQAAAAALAALTLAASAP